MEKPMSYVDGYVVVVPVHIPPITLSLIGAKALGMEQKPYRKDADFAQECSTCHLQAKDTGYVFTRKAPLP
jgi:hypothetical protein